jgi:hypothetical protein
MDESLDIGFKHHPVVITVFAAHLARHLVSKSTFNALETLVKRIKSDIAVMQSTVNRLNGTRGNTCRDKALTIE